MGSIILFSGGMFLIHFWTSHPPIFFIYSFYFLKKISTSKNFSSPKPLSFSPQHLDDDLTLLREVDRPVSVSCRKLMDLALKAATEGEISGNHNNKGAIRLSNKYPPGN